MAHELIGAADVRVRPANRLANTLRALLERVAMRRWVVVVLHWDTSLSEGIRLIWGFIKDVFGWCAASGYVDDWGLRCIPYYIEYLIPFSNGIP